MQAHKRSETPHGIAQDHWTPGWLISAALLLLSYVVALASINADSIKNFFSIIF